MEDKGREFFDNLSFVQSRQALTEDLPAASRVRTEELANRKNQLDGSAFPRQVAKCRRYRLGALSDCQPQDGQVDFSSLVFTANRTSSEQKEIFSRFNRSGAARIVFIHRYFLTLANLFTNLPPEPTDPPYAPTMSIASVTGLYSQYDSTPQEDP